MIRWFERNVVVSWLVVFVIAIGIFYVSSLTFGSGKGGGLGLQGIFYHLGAFFLLAFFLCIALVRGRHRWFLLVSFLASFLYGASDEIHQLFVPGRHGSLGDVLLDGVGSVFAVLVYWIHVEAR